MGALENFWQRLYKEREGGIQAHTFDSLKMEVFPVERHAGSQGAEGRKGVRASRGFALIFLYIHIYIYRKKKKVQYTRTRSFR